MEQLLAGEALTGLDVFDVHGHLGAWNAFFLPHRGTVASTLAVMDRCGVANLAVSSMLAIGPDTLSGNQAALDAQAEAGGRIMVWVVANPHRPEEEPALTRWLGLPGVVGIKIHPDTHQCPADDERYAWIYAMAERLGRPILAHSFADTPWSDPVRFAASAAAFPTCRIVMAHAGVTPVGFRRAAAACRAHPSLLVDTSGSNMTGRWIRWLIDEIGSDRVLYGSDAPFIDLRYGLGRVVGSDLDDRALRRVIGGNARELVAG